MTPFNIPHVTGKEGKYIEQVLNSGHIAGNGKFTKKCQHLFKENYGFQNIYLTPSCTNALEMAALMCSLRPGVEVILPSFTHVGTANAFAKTGAELRFADSLPDHPNIDPESVAKLIGPKTRAIVVVHYAGMSCQIETLQDLAKSSGLFLIEDAAHAIGASYRDKPLGSFGDFAALSFHETKNINCGQGGMLIVNRPDLSDKAFTIWHQGTDREAFNKGERDHYSWKAIGGAYQLAEVNAAILYSQLLEIDKVNSNRLKLYKAYQDALFSLQTTNQFELPKIPSGAVHNAHIFYLLVKDNYLRNEMLNFLNKKGVHAVFHYNPLHGSSFAITQYGKQSLPNAESIAERIIRLPLYNSMESDIMSEVTNAVNGWMGNHISC